MNIRISTDEISRLLFKKLTMRKLNVTLDFSFPKAVKDEISRLLFEKSSKRK